MFKYTIFLILAMAQVALHCTNAYASTSCENPIEITSPVIKFADGSFFNATTIENIHGFQEAIRTIVFGVKKLKEPKRIGQYSYQENLLTAHELAAIEKELESNKATMQEAEYQSLKIQLNACLEKIKEDFVTVSTKYRKIAKGSSKQATAQLVKESCTNHGNPESLFIALTKAEEKDETPLFMREVTSLEIFDSLCFDILNFFNDLVHSCPKAQAQLQQRIEKWKHIQSLLKEIHVDPMIKKNDAHKRFLKHIKINYLDKLPLHEINLKTIQMLFNEFIAQQNNQA